MINAQSTADDSKKSCYTTRKRNSILLNLIITLGLVFLLIIIFSALCCIRHLNDAKGIIRLLEYILVWAQFTVLLMFIAWIFCILRLFISKSVVFSLGCFTFLFVLGSSFYFMAPVDRDDEDLGNTIIESKITSPTEHDSKTKRIIKESFQLAMEAPNRAISAFFPSRGGFERLQKEKQAVYFCFHILVLLFVAAILFSHFGREFGNIIKRLIFVFFKKQKLNVFWGLNDVGLLLAKNIINTTEDEEIVFVLPIEMRFHDEQLKMARWNLDSLNVPWVFSDFNKPTKLDLYGHRHFFLNLSGAINVNYANKLYEEMKRRGIYRPNEVLVYVRMSANEDDQILSAWANKVKDCFTPIIISESDIIARKFIDSYPILDCPGVEVDTNTAKVNGECHVLLLGFGSVGSRLLREIICNGQFEGNLDLSVDIIEENKAKIEAYKLQHKEAMAKYKINFHTDVKVDGIGYEKFLEDNFLKYNRIIVCLGNDIVNISVASRLAHFVTDEGIGTKPGVLFVHVTDANNYLYFDAKSFGYLDDIYSFKSIDYSTIEEMAKIFHWEWVKGKEIDDTKDYKWSDVLSEISMAENTPVARIRKIIGYVPSTTINKKACLKKLIDITWSKASFAKKLSSRAAAFGEKNSVRLLGFELVRDSNGCHVVSEVEFNNAIKRLSGGSPDTCLAVLARNEHLRWNAYHRMLGYSKWDMVRPDINKLENKEANQLDTFWKHACIADFDDLPKVDVVIAQAKDPTNNSINEDDYKCDFYGNSQKDSYQKYDYDFVKAIWENVEASGMKMIIPKEARK